jgi:surfeit locus 1 family protein
VTVTPPEKKRFRPRFWAIAIAVPGLILLVALGVWQLNRLAWKTDLIALREARLADPAVALSDDVAKLEFRRVLVEGEFLHDKEIFLAATRDGRFGFHLITPLKRTDGTYVLINRGWIPPGMRESWLRADSRTDGQVTLEGVIRSSPGRGRLTPENDVEKNYWFWRDYASMAAFAGVDAPLYMIEAGPAENPGGVPIGREFKVDIPNDHFQYVIVWFSLAVILAVIFFLSQRTPVGRPKSDDKPNPDEGTD